MCAYTYRMDDLRLPRKHLAVAIKDHGSNLVNGVVTSVFWTSDVS